MPTSLQYVTFSGLSRKEQQESVLGLFLFKLRQYSTDQIWVFSVALTCASSHKTVREDKMLRFMLAKIKIQSYVASKLSKFAYNKLISFIIWLSFSRMAMFSWFLRLVPHSLAAAMV